MLLIVFLQIGFDVLEGLLFRGGLGAVLRVPALGHDTGQEAGDLLIDAHVPDIVLRARQGQELGEQAGESGGAVSLGNHRPAAPLDIFFVDSAHTGTIEMNPFQ